MGEWRGKWECVFYWFFIDFVVVGMWLGWSFMTHIVKNERMKETLSEKKKRKEKKNALIQHPSLKHTRHNNTSLSTHSNIPSTSRQHPINIPSISPLISSSHHHTINIIVTIITIIITSSHHTPCGVGWGCAAHHLRHHITSAVATPLLSGMIDWLIDWLKERKERKKERRERRKERGKKEKEEKEWMDGWLNYWMIDW